MTAKDPPSREFEKVDVISLGNAKAKRSKRETWSLWNPYAGIVIVCTNGGVPVGEVEDGWYDNVWKGTFGCGVAYYVW